MTTLAPTAVRDWAISWCHSQVLEDTAQLAPTSQTASSATKTTLITAQSAETHTTWSQTELARSATAIVLFVSAM